MTFEQREWSHARDELVRMIADLGFPEELGNEVAKNLRFTKAMQRMMGCTM